MCALCDIARMFAYLRNMLQEFPALSFMLAYYKTVGSDCRDSERDGCVVFINHNLWFWEYIPDGAALVEV